MASTKIKRIPRPDLARVRRAAGLTQDTLAKRMGVHLMTVIRWESGQSVIPDRRLVILQQVCAEARMLGLSTADWKHAIQEGTLQAGHVQSPVRVKNPRTILLSIFGKGDEYARALDGMLNQVLDLAREHAHVKGFCWELPDRGMYDGIVQAIQGELPTTRIEGVLSAAERLGLDANQMRQVIAHTQIGHNPRDQFVEEDFV